MFCTNCGVRFEGYGRFCVSCGTANMPVPESATEHQTYEQYAQYPQHEQVQYMQYPQHGQYAAQHGQYAAQHGQYAAQHGQYAAQHGQYAQQAQHEQYYAQQPYGQYQQIVPQFQPYNPYGTVQAPHYRYYRPMQVPQFQEYELYGATPQAPPVYGTPPQLIKRYSTPRHIWRALYPCFIFFGLSFFAVLVGLIGAVIYIIPIAIRAELAGERFDETLFEHLYADFALSISLIAFASITLFFALMWRKIRLKLPQVQNNELTSLNVAATIILSAGMCYVVAALLSFIDVYRFIPSYEDIVFYLTDGSFILRILVIGFGAPFAEELVFRGVIFNRLCSWMPVWVAILVSSVLFGIMHLNVIQGIYATLAGVVLCVLYVRYRNLWIPIIGHMAFNLVSVITDELMTVTGIEINAFLIFVFGSMMIVAGAVMVKRHTKPAIFKSEPYILPPQNWATAK